MEGLRGIFRGSTALEEKVAGNEALKVKNLDKALIHYNRAIGLCEGAKEQLILIDCLKNRAALHLKREKYSEVIEDCNRALELSKNNEKALFRRCQAFEAMGEVRLAFPDARLIHRLYKKNTEILPILIRLSRCVSGLEESTGNLSINAGVRQQNSIAELLNKNIGVSDFALRIKTPKDICSPERWIETEIVNGSKQGAQLKQTEKKFTFMLGAGFSRTGDSIDSRLKAIKSAAELLYDRHFRDQVQIFVPDQYLPKNTKVFADQATMERKLKGKSKAGKNHGRKEREKAYWRSQYELVKGDQSEEKVYSALRSFFEETGDRVMVLNNYPLSKRKGPIGAKGEREKDFLIINLSQRYVMNIEVKGNPSKDAVERGCEQLSNTKNLLEVWFGTLPWINLFNCVKVLYTNPWDRQKQPSESINNISEDTMMCWIQGPEDVPPKMSAIHNFMAAINEEKYEPSTELDRIRLRSGFETLVKNLLFYTTLHDLPITCNLDRHISKSINSIKADHLDFWNSTPQQTSILNSSEPCVMFTSGFSTGKTLMMIEKAKQQARYGEKVLFIVMATLGRLPEDKATEEGEKKLVGYYPIMLQECLEIAFSEFQNIQVEMISQDMGNDMQNLLDRIAEEPDSSIFIDELSLSKHSKVEKIEKIANSRKMQGKLLWVAIGKLLEESEDVKARMYFLEKWVNTQQTFWHPDLSYSMRNAATIAEFARTDNSRNRESVFEKWESWIGHDSKRSGHWLINPPNKDKPKVPKYFPQGKVERVFQTRFDQTEEDLLREAFRHLPNRRVVIVTKFNRELPHNDGESDPEECEQTTKRRMKIIQKIWGHEPLLLSGGYENNAALPSADDIKEFGKWLTDSTDDRNLMTSVYYMSGFEWPSILFIEEIEEWDSNNERISMDTALRCASTLVQLKFGFCKEWRSEEMEKIRAMPKEEAHHYISQRGYNIDGSVMGAEHRARIYGDETPPW